MSDFTHRMMHLDMETYLPGDILTKVDRAAMGVSLEGRIPLLDTNLIEFAWTIPYSMKVRDGKGKWLMRETLYRHVPKAMIDRPKRGFGIPLDVWLRGPLRDWAEDLLSESRLKREGFFHPAPIRQKWQEHLSGTRPQLAFLPLGRPHVPGLALTMFQSYFKVPNVEWAYWTLAEELRFYILVALLLALKQWHRMLAFVAVWMVLCFVDLFKHVPLAHYEMTLDQAPFFAAGMVYYDAFKRGFRPVHWVLIAATAALGCKRFLDWSLHDAIERHAVCSPVVIVCILLTMHLVFIGIASHKLAIRKNFGLLTMAGGMTYPLYLIHNRVGFSTIIALEPTLGRWQALVLTCLGALVLAYGIWKFWELPFATLLRRLKGRSAGQPELTKPVPM